MNTIINHTVKVTVPEDMRILTAEEKTQFFSDRRLKHEDNWCIRNEENHTCINVCSKKRPLLLGRMASLDAQRDATEKKIAGMIPGFEKLGHSERTIDGVRMCTFRCRYPKENILQYGEYDLFIRGNYFYAIQCIYRDGYQDFAERKFEEFLNSISFE